MSEFNFLDALDPAFSDLSDDSSRPGSEVSSGLICILLDRWQEHRERLGYRGLYRLRRQVLAQLRRVVGESHKRMILSESGVVVLVNRAQCSVAELAGSIFHRLEGRQFRIGRERVTVTVSLSFSPFDFRFDEAEQMLVEVVSQAETARERGGNTQVEAWPRIRADQALSDERQMLRLLMQCLQGDSIRLVFQPLLPTGDDSMQSFQMLPRLPTRDGQLLPAAHWLGLARARGLLCRLDRWMLSQAIARIDRQVEEHAFRLLISQSAERLATPEALQKLVRQLHATSRLDGRLILDFRWTEVAAHLPALDEIVELGRRQNFAVCLSMISLESDWQWLERLRCDYLRLAPSLVRRMTSDEGNGPDFEQWAGRLRSQGARLIMPMVEDPQTAARLWQSEVDYLQGNLIQPAGESMRLSH